MNTINRFLNTLQTHMHTIARNLTPKDKMIAAVAIGIFSMMAVGFFGASVLYRRFKNLNKNDHTITIAAENGPNDVKINANPFLSIPKPLSENKKPEEPKSTVETLSHTKTSQISEGVFPFQSTSAVARKHPHLNLPLLAVEMGIHPRFLDPRFLNDEVFVKALMNILNWKKSDLNDTSVDLQHKDDFIKSKIDYDVHFFPLLHP